MIILKKIISHVLKNLTTKKYHIYVNNKTRIAKFSAYNIPYTRTNFKSFKFLGHVTPQSFSNGTLQVVFCQLVTN